MNKLFRSTLCQKFDAVQLEFIDYHLFLNFIHALLRFSDVTCCILCVVAYYIIVCHLHTYDIQVHNFG